MLDAYRPQIEHTLGRVAWINNSLPPRGIVALDDGRHWPVQAAMDGATNAIVT
jgi:hypothetical protein